MCLHMYVTVFLCVHVCTTCVSTCVGVSVFLTVCVWLCVGASVPVCMYVRMCLGVFHSVCVCVRNYVSDCMWVCLTVCAGTPASGSRWSRTGSFFHGWWRYHQTRTRCAVARSPPSRSTSWRSCGRWVVHVDASWTFGWPTIWLSWHYQNLQCPSFLKNVQVGWATSIARPYLASRSQVHQKQLQVVFFGKICYLLLSDGISTVYGYVC